MTEPIDRLLAAEDIKQLKARYFRLVDTQDWDALRDVFTDDVVAVMGSGDVLYTADALVAQLRDNLSGGSSVHHGHMPEIDLTSPTTATGVWSLFDWIVWNPSAPSPYDCGPDRRGGTSFTGYARYWEHYRKTDGLWRIASMRIERLRLVPQHTAER